MLRLRDLQSHDPPMQLLIFILIQPLKLKSSTCLAELSPNKQCCLIASSRGKDYLKINAFLASDGEMERNLEALQIKVTTSLGGRAIRKTSSSIESLDGGHRAE